MMMVTPNRLMQYMETYYRSLNAVADAIFGWHGLSNTSNLSIKILLFLSAT